MRPFPILVQRTVHQNLVDASFATSDPKEKTTRLVGSSAHSDSPRPGATLHYPPKSIPPTFGDGPIPNSFSRNI